jgi:hypothetical protein
MVKETKYVCQIYKKTARGQLILDETIECRSEIAAEMRAEKLWQSGNHEGVDALVIAADPEQGEYDEPVFLTRLGNVPDTETMD